MKEGKGSRVEGSRVKGARGLGWGWAGVLVAGRLGWGWVKSQKN